MKCNRLNKYGSFFAIAMVVLVSAIAADAQPLIPIDQRRHVDTFAYLPQCGQQGSAQDLAVGFTPFNGLVQTVLGCPAASLDGFAEQQSQIGVASMSANGVVQSDVVAAGPDTIISLQNSSFEVTFQLSSLSRFVLTGLIEATTTNALIGAGSSAVITLKNEANEILFRQTAVHAGGANTLVIDEFDVLPPGEYVLSAGASSVIDDAVMGAFLSRATYDIAVDVAVLGDIDDDGDVDFDDVNALVAVLLGMPLDPAHVARADLNNDGSADGLDIPLCLEALLFVPPPPPPPPGPTVNTVAYAPGPIVSNCPFSFTVASVQGAGFDPAVTAKLTQPGRPDIPASGIVFTNALFFEAVFGDLSGISTGLWQLEVANPGTALTVAQDRLTIVQCP